MSIGGLEGGDDVAVVRTKSCGTAMIVSCPLLGRGHEIAHGIGRRPRAKRQPAMTEAAARDVLGPISFTLAS